MKLSKTAIEEKRSRNNLLKKYNVPSERQECFGIYIGDKFCKKCSLMNPCKEVGL